MTKLEQLVKLKNQYIEMMKNDGKAIITEWLVQLAEYVPDLEFFTWTQDTPSLNDGDPCVFSTNGLYYFTHAMRDEYKQDDEDSYMAELSPAELANETDGMCATSYSKSNAFYDKKDFVKALDNNDELFEHVFGDNSRIVALPIRKDNKIVGFEYEVSDYGY